MAPWAPCCKTAIPRSTISAARAWKTATKTSAARIPNGSSTSIAPIIEAGADIVSTNSFQASPIVLAEFGLADRAQELNVLAAQLARQAADEFSTAAKPRFVAGSMGPTTKSITLRGDVSFEQLRDSYYIQARALVEGGVDLLLIETCFDTRNVKAALLGDPAICAIGSPSIMSPAPSSAGAPCSPASPSTRSTPRSRTHDLFAIGLNCATGPDLMTDHIRTLAEMAAMPRLLLSRTPACPTKTASIWRRPNRSPRSSRNSSTTAG